MNLLDLELAIISDLNVVLLDVRDVNRHDDPVFALSPLQSWELTGNKTGHEKFSLTLLYCSPPFFF